MAYKLKQNVEAFTVVDGPFAKQSYKHGVEYNEVPPQEKRRFEKVKPVKTATLTEHAEGAKVKAKAKKKKGKL